MADLKENVKAAIEKVKEQFISDEKVLSQIGRASCRERV